VTPAEVLLAIKAHQQREQSADWRAGLITAALLNVHRGKGTKAAKPEDFVRKPESPREPQSPERMATLLKAYTLALGGEVQC
jgi:hypothetical protein